MVRQAPIRNPHPIQYTIPLYEMHSRRKVSQSLPFLGIISPMAKAYRYCPYCATPLVEAFRFDDVRPTCAACGFTQFQDPKVAVIARVIYEKRVLLVQRGVDPAKGRWALPGGFMDADESPEMALSRELNEEVALAVNVGELLKIYAMTDGDGNRTGIVLAYTATPTGVTTITANGHDVQNAGWFGPDEIPAALAFESTITLINEWLAHNSL